MEQRVTISNYRAEAVRLFETCARSAGHTQGRLVPEDGGSESGPDLSAVRWKGRPATVHLGFLTLGLRLHPEVNLLSGFFRVFPEVNTFDGRVIKLNHTIWVLLSNWNKWKRWDGILQLREQLAVEQFTPDAHQSLSAPSPVSQSLCGCYGASWAYRMLIYGPVQLQWHSAFLPGVLVFGHSICGDIARRRSSNLMT